MDIMCICMRIRAPSRAGLGAPAPTAPFISLAPPPISGRNRFCSNRFGPVIFEKKHIVSVRFGNCFSRFDAVRPALFERVVARCGSVRFGSAFGSGRFRN